MKTACVTGADRGLGLAFVKLLMAKDYRVFAGKYLEKSEGLDNLAEKHQDKVYPVHIDVSSDQSVTSAAAYIRDRTEHIDLLINNAAILGDIENTIADKLDYNEILQVINVNAVGALRVSQSLYALVAGSSQKTIVNISSEAGSIGQNARNAWFGYCMSKAALNMCGALMHTTLKAQGGSVLQIHPGWIKSHMRGVLDEKADYTPDEAAYHILKVVENHSCDEPGDGPLFLDLLGNKLPW